MVDVRSKRCSHEGCATWPSYGADGSKKAEYCARHSLPGMVDVCNKRCGMRGCTIRPSHGYENSSAEKKPEFCARHAMAGMVDVRNKRCGHRGGCEQPPTYCVPGKAAAEFCARHAEAGMVRVRAAPGGRRSRTGGDLSSRELHVIDSVRDLPPFPADSSPQAPTPAPPLPSAAAAGGNSGGGWGDAPVAPPHARRPDGGAGAADTDGAGDLLLALSGKAGSWRWV